MRFNRSHKRPTFP